MSLIATKPKVGNQHDELPAAFTKRPSRGLHGAALNLSVLAASAGMIAAVALPSYALDAQDPTASNGVPAAVDLPAAQPQTVELAADIAAPTVQRDSFAATTEDELAAIRAEEQRQREAAEAAAAAEAEAEAAAAASATATAAPASSGASVDVGTLGGIAGIAMQYQGVPYVFGGATPAGFDCSGFTMYVYAQAGISLPHSSSAQAAMGTPVSTAEAVPGDLVIMEGGGHVGIYLGNGMMIDAPYPGKTVQARAIYSSNYYIVRI